MKKLLSVFLIICLLLPVAAFCEEEAASEAPPTPTEVRYHFEHRFLPQLLFEDPQQLFTFLSGDDVGIFYLWNNFTQNNGFDTVYSVEDFGQNLIEKDDGVLIYQLIMPDPEVTPLCNRIYLCWNVETGETGFYTIEFDDMFGVDMWYLCGWKPDGVHENYGYIESLPSSDENYGQLLQEEPDVVLALWNSGAIPEGTYNSFSNEVTINK